jgi:GNAT superfamily N-acetyltransferase
MLSGIELQIRRIEKYPYHGNHFDYYVSNGDVIGDVDLFFTTLDYFDSYLSVLSLHQSIVDISSGIIASDFLKSNLLALSDDAVIGLMRSFYPNGIDDAFIEKNERHGVGSMVLDQITRDAVAYGARALVVETITSYSAERFFLKNGFEPLIPEADDYIKIIQ